MFLSLQYILFYITIVPSISFDSPLHRDQECTRGSQCLYKDDCPLYQEFLKSNTFYQNQINEWKTRVCNRKEKKLCCPIDSCSLSQEWSHDYLPRSMLGQCGKNCVPTFKRRKRASGGVNAKLGEFPWAAMIGFKVRKGRFDYECRCEKLDEITKYRCGGTLVNNWYVLTAANCLEGNNKVSSVVLGEWEVGVDPDCLNGGRKCLPPRQSIEVDSVTIHENFIRNTITGEVLNDIALIRLKQPAVFNKAVQPICLPLNKEQVAKDIGANNLIDGIVGREATVIGWGEIETFIRKTTGIGNETVPHPILQKVDVPIISNEDCKSRLAELDQEDVDKRILPTHVCAGQKGSGKDACKGDSGGGLFIRETIEEDSIYHQIGLVSFGLSDHCGLYGGVYTRITEFIPWITRNIYSNITTTKTTTTEKECDTLPEVPHSSSIFVDENVIEYTCNQGYIINGSSALSCREGAWYPSPPSCHPICESKPCHPSALCSLIPAGRICECKEGDVGDPYKAGCHLRSRFTDVISDTTINTCGYKRHNIDTPHVQCGGSVSGAAAPWQVSIIYRGSPRRIHWCGGVIVSLRHILSAAHCFESSACNFWSRQGNRCDKTHFLAFFGRTNTTIIHPDDTFLEDSNSVEREIEKVYIHPKWQYANRISGGNDISILTVKEVPLNTYIRPACLPNPADASFFLHQQKSLIEITGFGRNNSDITPWTKSFPHQLHLIQMKIIEKRTCNSRLTGQVATDIFCSVPANNGTGDCLSKPGSCKGDSGGPGVVRYKYNQHVVIGLVSGGPACGEDELFQPHYFTSVSHHITFILDYMEDRPCPPPLGVPPSPTCNLRFVEFASGLFCQEILDCPKGARCFDFKCTFYKDDDQARLARTKCTSSQQCQEGAFVCDPSIARCRPDKATNGTVVLVAGGIQTLYVPKISTQDVVTLPNDSSRERSHCSGNEPCPVRTTNNRITCHKAFCNRSGRCWCPYPVSRRLNLSTGQFVDPE